MRTAERYLVGLLLLAVLVAFGGALTHWGMYGLTLFIGFPIVLGGLASWVVRPATGTLAFMLGMFVGSVGLLGFLLMGQEGLACIVMSLPLALPLAGLGSWFVYHASGHGVARQGAAMLLLLPPGIVWDSHAVPPVFQVRTSIVIAAPAEEVWKHVVTFSELPEPDEWYFRAGLAYPKRAHIVGSGAGAVRYCEFSTGPIVEPIEVWQEPRLLRFRVTENPAPMHEWSPYAKVLPKHLHGYLVSEHGQFLLTALAGNRTLLEGTTWYRHGLWPAGYWRLWSDAIIHRIHLRVLTHIKMLAEKSW